MLTKIIIIFFYTRNIFSSSIHIAPTKDALQVIHTLEYFSLNLGTVPKAVYLSQLDYAMEKLCKKKKIYYIRYVDDLIILAKSRCDLRRSLKILYSVLSDLKLKVHTEEKRFIGKIEKGFSFLGYWFKLYCKLRPSKESLKRLVSNSIRLYEQKATRKQLLEYLERWLIHFRGGLRGITQTKSITKLEKFIEYNFKITYKYYCRLI